MWNIAFCICLTQGFLSIYSLSSDENLRSQLNHFRTTRNNYIKPEDKTKAREHIVKTFKDFGLDTWTQEFPSNQASYPGVNVIGRVNGRYTGTSKDKILIIGTHYDTEETTNGVDDNGSGMSAMLQILAKYKSPNNANCKQNYTLLFVAFDLEEYQGCGLNSSCPCADGLCGSGYFVQNLTRHLNNTEVTVQGAFVLETILNYNTTENSQIFPPVVQLVLKKEYDIVKNNKFKGDFLSVIGRQTDDAELMEQLVSNFDQGRFKAMKIPLPFSGKTSDLTPDNRKNMRQFLRSDHARFWNSANSWPAVFITDTADFRGYMRTCYHKMCDTIDRVTPDMITFMGKTADALVKAAHGMSGRVCPKEHYCNSNTRITSNKETISTPSYPSKYPNGLNCSWYKDSEYPQVLEFTDFDLENSTNDSDVFSYCKNDYVEVIAGGISLGRYCGSKKPDPISTTEKSLRIRFVSDAFVSKRGFKATWTTKGPVGTATRSYGCQYLVMASLLSAILISLV